MAINIKCKNCGELVSIKADSSAKVQCSSCGAWVSLVQDKAVYEELLNGEATLEKELEKLVDDYRNKEKASSDVIKAKIETCERNDSVLDFDKVWCKFIIKATGAAIAKNDKTLKTHIKNHIQDYDAKYKTDIFASVVRAYPEMGSINDWDNLIKATDGDPVKFGTLSENVVKYIVDYKDKAFAMNIFYILSAGDEKWVDATRMYLQLLLSSEDVANKVFTQSSFNKKTKKFILDIKQYCRKNLSGNKTILPEESKVWVNYTAACKHQKKVKLGIVCAVAVVVIGAATGTFTFLNSVNVDTVNISIDDVIEMTYGDDLKDILENSDYTISYKKRSGADANEPVTIKMIEGYDASSTAQQTVVVNFKGVKKNVIIITKSSELDAPVLRQSGNTLLWDEVAHASSYSVYINSQSTPIATVTECNYDLSSYSASADNSQDTLTVYVRANAESSKYTNSAMSQSLVVKKLKAVSDVKYENGMLTWNSVDGASSYDLSISGTTYNTETNSYKVALTAGTNTQISIVSRSSDDKVVTSAYEVTIYYLKPISGMSYKNDSIYWDAEENASSYDVYVDGTYWQTFMRNNFSITGDKFTEKFEETKHTIGIVSKSAISNTAASEMKEYTVAIGNKVKLEDGTIKWDVVGTSATYKVTVNGGAEQSLSSNYLPDSIAHWQDGENTVVIKAAVGNEEIICETVTVTKLAKPTLKIESNQWVKGSGNVYYKVDGGEATKDLPDIDTFTAGDHTIVAQAVAENSSSLVLDSDEVSLKVKKIDVPVIAMKSGAISVNGQANYETNGEYQVEIYYCDTEDGRYSQITSLSSLTAGEHFIKIKLSEKSGATSEYDCVIRSEYSNVVSVKKLSAPDVSYTDGDTRVTSTASGNIGYYYTDSNGNEQVLTDGLVSNLPKGTFTVYAKSLPVLDNEIMSDATPEKQRVTVSNLNMTVTINKSSATSSTVNVVFSGCKDVESFSYTYEIVYYDASGNVVGRVVYSQTQTKNNTGNSDKVSFGLSFAQKGKIVYETGKTKDDAVSAELIVHITDSNNQQTQTLTSNRIDYILSDYIKD